jgi:hypothetical protein
VLRRKFNGIERLWHGLPGIGLGSHGGGAFVRCSAQCQSGLERCRSAQWRVARAQACWSGGKRGLSGRQGPFYSAREKHGYKESHSGLQSRAQSRLRLFKNRIGVFHF